MADRLVQLDELRRRGIVTDAEFASKKAELLDRSDDRRRRRGRDLETRWAPRAARTRQAGVRRSGEVERPGLGERHHASAEPGPGQPGPEDARAALRAAPPARRARASTPRSRRARLRWLADMRRPASTRSPARERAGEPAHPVALA